MDLEEKNKERLKMIISRTPQKAGMYMKNGSS